MNKGIKRLCNTVLQMLLCTFICGSILLFILFNFDLTFRQQIFVGAVILILCYFICSLLLEHWQKNPVYPWYVWAILFFLLAYLSGHLVGPPMTVDGHSMEPGLHNRDVVFCSIVYDTRTIKRGDIVIVKHGDREIVKRVLALPGETTTLDALRGVPEVTLGEDEFYITGDNYKNSLDSRYFGPVKSDAILYKAFPVLPPVFLFFWLIMIVFFLSVLILPPEALPSAEAEDAEEYGDDEDDSGEEAEEEEYESADDEDPDPVAISG